MFDRLWAGNRACWRISQLSRRRIRVFGIVGCAAVMVVGVAQAAGAALAGLGPGILFYSLVTAVFAVGVIGFMSAAVEAVRADR
jgi:hypothetical protein